MGSANPPGSKVPETVLLVEDDLYIRMLAVDVLEEAGYHVIEAVDADVAMWALEDDPEAVSILVTDVNMPGEMNGIELAKTVHQRWPSINIVITSGRERLAQSDVPDDGLFLPKPWTIGTMLNTIRTAGQNSR